MYEVLFQVKESVAARSFFTVFPDGCSVTGFVDIDSPHKESSLPSLEFQSNAARDSILTSVQKLPRPIFPLLLFLPYFDCNYSLPACAALTAAMLMLEKQWITVQQKTFTKWSVSPAVCVVTLERADAN